MAPESLPSSPAFTPQRRTLSLAQHWINTGRSGNIAPVVQLFMESGDPKFMIEARDMLNLLIESQGV